MNDKYIGSDVGQALREFDRATAALLRLYVSAAQLILRVREADDSIADRAPSR